MRFSKLQNIMIIIFVISLLSLTSCAEKPQKEINCLEPSFEGKPDDAPIAFELESVNFEGKTYFWPIILSEEKELCYFVMNEDSIVQQGEIKITGSVDKTVQGAEMKFLSTDLNISMERGSTLYISRPGKRTATKNVKDIERTGIIQWPEEIVDSNKPLLMIPEAQILVGENKVLDIQFYNDGKPGSFRAGGINQEGIIVCTDDTNVTYNAPEIFLETNQSTKTFINLSIQKDTPKGTYECPISIWNLNTTKEVVTKRIRIYVTN